MLRLFGGFYFILRFPLVLVEGDVGTRNHGDASARCRGDAGHVLL